MRLLSLLICVLFAFHGKAVPVTDNILDIDTPVAKPKTGVDLPDDDKPDELSENTLEHDIATVLKELNLIPHNDTPSLQDTDLPTDDNFNITKDFPTDHIEDDTEKQKPTQAPSTTQPPKDIPSTHTPTHTKAPYQYPPPLSNTFLIGKDDSSLSKSKHEGSSPVLINYSPISEVRKAKAHVPQHPYSTASSKPYSETTLNTLNYYVPLHSHVISKLQSTFPQPQWMYKPQASSYDAPIVPNNNYIPSQPTCNPSPCTNYAPICPCMCNQHMYNPQPPQLHHYESQYRPAPEHQYVVTSSAYRN